MRSLRSLLPISVPILLASSVHAQNLIQNGSFESPDVAGGTAQVFPNGGVPGWTDTSFGECGIEIQDNCCGSPAHGDQFVEIDSDCSALVTQSVATQAGASYVLSFLYSPRPGLPLGSSPVQVSWNGNVIDTADGVALGGTNWEFHSTVVTATGTSSTIEFADLSASDGVGGYIDNVPEPAGSAQLAAGLALLASLSRVHRRGRSR